MTTSTEYVTCRAAIIVQIAGSAPTRMSARAHAMVAVPTDARGQVVCGALLQEPTGEPWPVVDPLNDDVCVRCEWLTSS